MHQTVCTAVPLCVLCVAAVKVVLITGASSGIGRAMVGRLAARGYRVFGTSRQPVGPEVEGVPLLPLDVRDAASVAACLATVLARAGRVDVLVNNAGYGLAGAVEEVTPADLQAQLETNLIGVARVTRAVLPVMRAQGGGRIVAVSSMAGQIGLPFFGAYAASKFALEGYMEALRHEVRPFNIQVALIVPGRIRTDFRRRLLHAAPLDAYAPWRTRAEATRQGGRLIEPEQVADCLLGLLTSPDPRLRSYVGREALALAVLRRLLPEAWLARLIRRAYRLDG